MRNRSRCHLGGASQSCFFEIAINGWWSVSTMTTIDVDVETFTCKHDTELFFFNLRSFSPLSSWTSKRTPQASTLRSSLAAERHQSFLWMHHSRLSATCSHHSTAVLQYWMFRQCLFDSVPRKLVFVLPLPVTVFL